MSTTRTSNNENTQDDHASKSSVMVQIASSLQGISIAASDFCRLFSCCKPSMEHGADIPECMDYIPSDPGKPLIPRLAADFEGDYIKKYSTISKK